MNSKSTLGWLLLALGLFAYIVFFERHSKAPASGTDLARRLFPDLEPDKVTSVEILRSNTVIRAERTNDQWRLTRPAYPAQATAINNWLALLGSLNQRAYLTAQELLAQPGGLADFGLETPIATVNVQQAARRFQFRLGSKTTVGDMLYLQQVGSDGAHVTEAALLDRLPQTATDWRDPQFLDLAGLDFNRLQVRAGEPRFEMQRDSATQIWRLTRPRSARADNGLLQQVLQQLQTVRISRFVSDVPGGDLEPYGLQPPALTLVFARETNTVLTVELGKSPTNEPAVVFARRSNYPNIVTVPKQVLDLLRAPYTEFLDRRLIEFTPAAVHRIEARAAESFALEKQPNGRWQVVEPIVFPADPELVSGFLSRLNSIEIVEVAKDIASNLDLPDHGLAPPSRQYVLKAANGATTTNEILAQIEFGTNQTNRIVVRRTDENSIYKTKLEESLLLPQAAFELRDRRIWNFTTNHVASATIAVKGTTCKVLRTGSGQWSVAPGSQGMLNPFAIEEAMFRLGQQLRSKKWVARGDGDLSRFGFAEAANKLAIELSNDVGPRTLTVEFGSQSPSGGPFALVHLEPGPVVFECPFDVFNAYDEVVRYLTSTASAPP
jgi:uncharacterized protein DUF4340